MDAIMLNILLLLLLAGCAIGRIFYLQLSIAVASLLASIYYGVQTSPDWFLVAWGLAFFIASTLHLAVMLYEKQNLRFYSRDEKELYHAIFYHFSPAQYRKLLSHGKRYRVDAGVTLAEQGKELDAVSVIVKGKTAVYVDGKIIAYCKAGNLIGEISMLSGGPATATVVTIEPTNLISWEKGALMTLEKDPSTKEAMRTVFNVELVNKLSVPNL